jgi:hypothetical protein
MAHCQIIKCIIAKQNAEISTLYQGGNDYCCRCKRKLRL